MNIDLLKSNNSKAKTSAAKASSSNALIDVGVNLTNKRFDKDREEVIARAQSAALSGLLITGTSVAESKKALALCQQYQTDFPNFLYSTAGVHPHDADHVAVDYIAQLKQLAMHTQVKAIGECGLDFNRNFSTPAQQKIVFSEQVALAAELQMPLFLHQRDAFAPWFNILSPYLGKVPAMVAHCFTGSKNELMQCINADMYIGITGWLCDERRGQTLRDIVSLIPLNRLLIETDAPYLTPRTIRPKPKSSRNEPSYLPYILKEITSITGLDQEQIAWQTSRNAEKVFNFPTKRN
ncbi:3'-5' ssDNA/RNA exonuclease TatD [Colwellia marinimaniae]|uniref:3'-5' ssDNA/RNA exonuclease TatD n=1 Tax=Colwellia marinimaniae TaxID=1513592 RepID=A0ABQ0MRQ8_9GAMM|nr:MULTISPECIES: TatD family hydrolase [Colwellia]GAW95033.1 3'-5' ssDNA/RNA exonuclease TatD [Colwellia marinimaniae]